MAKFFILVAIAALITSSIALPRQDTLNLDLPWLNLSIASSPDSRYLHRANTGEPFLWIADTNWELFHRMNRTDADLYLSDRAAKGFTVVQAVLLSKLNVTEIPNFYGDLAIDNSDPYQLNQGYFQHVDWVVRRAAEYGLVIAFVPIWGRYVNWGWYGPSRPPRLYTEEAPMEYFGQYLGRKFPGVPIIMGGDTNAFWISNISDARAAWREDKTVDPWSLVGPVEDTRNLWAAMLRGLRSMEEETGVAAFVTYQPTNPSITGTPPAYGSNYINGSFGTLDMNAVQSGHESLDPNSLDAGFTLLTGWDSRKNYENIIAMRQIYPGPVMDVENHYEDAHDSFNTSKRIWNASDVRHGFYPALFSGACGITYGCLSVQQVYSPLATLARADLYIEPQLGLDKNESWRLGIHRPGASQTGFVGKLYAELNAEQVESLTPDRSFLRSPAGAADDILSYEGDRYVAGMVSKRQYWVYSGHGDSFAVDLNALGVYWGHPRSQGYAQWFDPRTGERQNVGDASLFSLTGCKDFIAPSSGGIDHDWVLVITFGDDLEQ